MDISKTFKFLKTAGVTVISSSNNKMLHDLLNYLSENNSDSKLIILNSERYDCSALSGERKVTITEKLTKLINTAKEKNIFYLFPLELVDCEWNLVTARLRSFYFYLSESNKPDIQMFNLHTYCTDVRLECEFGKNAGRYIIFDYDANNGKFTEKE